VPDLENPMLRSENTMVNPENTLIKNTRCRNACYFNYLTIVPDRGVFNFRPGVLIFAMAFVNFALPFVLKIMVSEKDPALRDKTRPDDDK